MYNDNYLAHYGVLGMKWGARKQRRLAKSAYRASGRMFGEKRRQAMIEKGRKHDEEADRLQNEIKNRKETKRSRGEKVASVMTGVAVGASYVGLGIVGAKVIKNLAPSTVNLGKTAASRLIEGF